MFHIIESFLLQRSLFNLDMTSNPSAAIFRSARHDISSILFFFFFVNDREKIASSVQVSEVARTRRGSFGSTGTSIGSNVVTRTLLLPSAWMGLRSRAVAASAATARGAQLLAGLMVPGDRTLVDCLRGVPRRAESQVPSDRVYVIIRDKRKETDARSRRGGST